MRKSVVLGSGILLAAIVVGCGGASEDSVVTDTISLMNDAAAILETVKDEKSAKAAETKLKGLEERGKALEKRTKEFSKEKLEAAGKKREKEVTAAVTRMVNATVQAMQNGLSKDALGVLPSK